MSGRKLYIDYSKCIGCESCEAICKFLYGVPRVQMSRTRDGRMFPLYCHHCDRPMCAQGCPEGVIAKESSGVVSLDRSAGRDCVYEVCAESCPFEAVFPGGGGLPITKCDLCEERREKGMPPACVLICPCEAIFYVSKEEAADLKTEASKKANKEVIQHIKNRKKRRKETGKPVSGA
jgi:Fe-S-cluster-containing dehydrogenase component